MRRSAVSTIILTVIIATAAFAAAPSTPKVDKVEPASPSPLAEAPGVFFHEDFDSITALSESFHDIGLDNGNFGISGVDSLSGGKSVRQTYRPLTQYGPGEDPGAAGWIWRMFGDNRNFRSSIPEEQQGKYETIVARWYHKFEEGFTPRDGAHFPPKMARLRCFTPSSWSGKYSVYFWISGDDGHITIERKTTVTEAHREWQPNFHTKFRFSDPVNVGRWVHFELRVELGEGVRSDRVQAWADGLLVCDVAGDDLAAGYRFYTPNGMSLDCYWNGGSPAAQSRFYDDFMLSTERIGPLRTGFNPVIVKNAFSSSGQADTQGGWEAEVAQAVQRPMEREQVLDRVATSFREAEVDYTVVWRGGADGEGGRLAVDTQNGEFTGPRTGQAGLAANTLHFVRVRQRNAAGEWSDWSSWHSGFATAWDEGAPVEQRTLPAGYMESTDAGVIGMDDTPPVIRRVQGPSAVPDTVGPYVVTALVDEENPLGVYVHFRFDGAGEYESTRMEQAEDGAWTGEIPGGPVGARVEYYVRAVDGFEHYAYQPADYQQNPLRFTVLNPSRWDLDGDGRTSAGDVLRLLLAGRRDSDDTALDYDGDGSFGAGDVLEFIRTILTGGADLLAGVTP